jgi:5'-phosphate synthase pdxT subunit
MASEGSVVTVIGVFALQGNVREHLQMLAQVGVEARPVRRPSELAEVDGLVLPGGESTTMDKLARSFELFEPLQKRIADGMPTFGTCAGMIMLANEITGGIEGQETLGGLDVTVRRNAFGRQVDSFEADLEFAAFDTPYHAVFIRAPWVERVTPGCTVTSPIWCTTFSQQQAVEGLGSRCQATPNGPPPSTRKRSSTRGAPSSSRS